MQACKQLCTDAGWRGECQGVARSHRIEGVSRSNLCAVHSTELVVRFEQCVFEAVFTVKLFPAKATANRSIPGHAPAALPTCFQSRQRTAL